MALNIETKRINAMQALTGIANDDSIIVELAGGGTKRMTYATLLHILTDAIVGGDSQVLTADDIVTVMINDNKLIPSAKLVYDLNAALAPMIREQNCINNGASGIQWDLDKLNGGVHVLSPYEAIGGAEWYKGTANAIYQNIAFIEKYDPEYVVILSGDHIYKMNYAKMIDFHKKNNADCTIAVLEVPWEEASRFGILATDENDKIYEFAEKPAQPKSNKASMGVYVFSWDKLRKYLTEDEANPESSNDFGKNIIPAMLADDQRMFAFPFNGYWKDVGTIDSLWEANLDIINPNVDLDLSDKTWKVYSRNPMAPPSYIDKNAVVENSSIGEGCEIDGNIDYSVVSPNVTVETGAEVKYSVIMPGAKIGKNAKVYYSIIAEDAVIEDGAQVGEIPENLDNPEDWGVAVVGSKAKIKTGTKIAPKDMIASGEEV